MNSLSLSAREQEVVRLVALGLPNKAIGAVLDISPWTVATHLRRIYAKLNVPSRAAMVAAVAETPGIFAPRDDSKNFVAPRTADALQVGD
jgi:DNA-binding CsgD family transcriptional regulator